MLADFSVAPVSSAPSRLALASFAESKFALRLKANSTGKQIAARQANSDFGRYSLGQPRHSIEFANDALWQHASLRSASCRFLSLLDSLGQQPKTRAKPL